jgi:hypothetical protein
LKFRHSKETNERGRCFKSFETEVNRFTPHEKFIWLPNRSIELESIFTAARANGVFDQLTTRNYRRSKTAASSDQVIFPAQRVKIYARGRRVP